MADGTLPFDEMLRYERLTPARDDIAASFLRGHVEAKKFVEPKVQEVRGVFAPLRRVADASAPLDAMLLHGTRFDVYETKDGWLWGQSQLDGYVGYAPAPVFGPCTATATHRVAVPMTHLYAVARTKAEPVGGLYMGSRVSVAGSEAHFSLLADGMAIPTAHLVPIDDTAEDFVAVAQRFLHAPYLWGGHTVAGIDCSGLVQVAMHAAGLDAPRDSDMQADTLGTPLDAGAPPARGDLIFWKGHVGIMVNKSRMLHATEHGMLTVEEPLADVRSRIKRNVGLDILTIRRPDVLGA